jgi:sulfite reductase alpha subunit-like flavoprotein
VDTFLKLNKLEDEADRPMIIDNLNHGTFRLSSRIKYLPFSHRVANTADQPLPRHLPRQTVTTLRRVLQRHLDLRAPPRKSFFEWLRRFSTEELEVDRLDEFIADPVSAISKGIQAQYLKPSLQDEIHEYATRSRRSVLETMAEFRNTKIPLSHVLEVLAPLRRRQFSIASSSKVRILLVMRLNPLLTRLRQQAHPGEIQLLVALVDYKTNLKVRRRGLLSSWLRDLKLDSRVPLRIEPPTLFLPEARNTPAILVGPGTGVAPMRAFVEERIANGEAKGEGRLSRSKPESSLPTLNFVAPPSSETALYFGCRSKDQDMYFAQEMETWRKHGVHVRVACSRDQVSAKIASNGDSNRALN